MLAEANTVRQCAHGLLDLLHREALHPHQHFADARSAVGWIGGNGEDVIGLGPGETAAADVDPSHTITVRLTDDATGNVSRHYAARRVANAAGSCEIAWSISALLASQIAEAASAAIPMVTTADSTRLPICPP